MDSASDGKQPTEQPTEQPAATQEPQVDPEKAKAFKEKIEAEQNLTMGIVGGVFAALVGAAVWAVITVTTQYQIGFMAIGVGFLVGYAVRLLGKGLTRSFGIAGALLALFGCVLGNLLSACGFLAIAQSQPFAKVAFAVLLSPAAAFELMTIAFNPMDVLFYGIAVYEGYRFSFRVITPEELASLTQTGPKSA